MAVVKLEDVIKNYKVGQVEVPAIRGISLSVEKGEFLTLAGPSGSGKSTLLNLFGCVDKPTAGRVFIGERNIRSIHPDDLAEIRNKHIGFIFQNFNLIPVLSAYENVEFPLLLLKKFSPAERKEKIMKVLESVGLGKLLDRRPTEMSGGQQQRVAIARALVKEPDYVLADEPTANLDSQIGKEILETMKSMNERLGITFIFSTHDPKVMAYAKRRIVIQDGKVESDDKQ